MQLKTNVRYKYGLNEKTIDIIFKKPYENIQITNNLCGGDPVYGQLKYLYDEQMNILCKEYNYVSIVISVPIKNVVKYTIKKSNKETVNINSGINNITPSTNVKSNKLIKMINILKKQIDIPQNNNLHN